MIHMTREIHFHSSLNTSSLDKLPCNSFKNYYLLFSHETRNILTHSPFTTFLQNQWNKDQSVLLKVVFSPRKSSKFFTFGNSILIIFSTVQNTIKLLWDMEHAQLVTILIPFILLLWGYEDEEGWNLWPFGHTRNLCWRVVWKTYS